MISIILSVFATALAAVAQPCEHFLSPDREPSVEYSQDRPLQFNETEAFRRNNRIGVQQLGNLQLERWIEIRPFVESSYNFLGLTADGRMYQVIDWYGRRRVARPLGGQHRFNDLFLLEGQVLAASDDSGRIWIYSPLKWAESPRGNILKKGAAMWAGFSTVLTAGIYMLAPEAAGLNADMFSIPVPILALFSSVISGLQTSFVMLNRFDQSNTFPDGFVKTEFRIARNSSGAVVPIGLTLIAIRDFTASQDLVVPDLDALGPRLTKDSTEEIR